MHKTGGETPDVLVALHNEKHIPSPGYFLFSTKDLTAFVPLGRIWRVQTSRAVTNADKGIICPELSIREGNTQFKSRSALWSPDCGRGCGVGQDTSLQKPSASNPKIRSALQEEGEGEELSGDKSSIKTAPACPSSPNPLQNCTTRLQPVLRAKPGSEQPHSPLKAVFSVQG